MWLKVKACFGSADERALYVPSKLIQFGPPALRIERWDISPINKLIKSAISSVTSSIGATTVGTGENWSTMYWSPTSWP